MCVCVYGCVYGCELQDTHVVFTAADPCMMKKVNKGLCVSLSMYTKGHMSLHALAADLAHTHTHTYETGRTNKHHESNDTETELKIHTHTHTHTRKVSER